MFIRTLYLSGSTYVRTYIPSHTPAETPESSLMGPRPRLSMYARECIRQLTREAAAIVEELIREGITTCRQTGWRIQHHLENHGVIKPLPKSGRPTKLTTPVLQSIENSMRTDDETTGIEVATTLKEDGVSVSTVTALKGWCLLSWTRRGMAC